MRKVYTFLGTVFFASSLCFKAFAASTATATVTFTIGTITEITVSGNPAPLNITAAVAGSPPTSATNASTTYSITTNATAQRVTGALNSAMPAGTSLLVTLAAPTGATSAGPVALTTTPQTLVSGISNIAQSGLTITYTLTATAAAAPVAGQTRVVTYTIGP